MEWALMLVIGNGKSYLVTETNLKELYWTPYQQLAHLASAGEGLSTGDIFGTGTVTSSVCYLPLFHPSKVIF